MMQEELANKENIKKANNKFKKLLLKLIPTKIILRKFNIS